MGRSRYHAKLTKGRHDLRRRHRRLRRAAEERQQLHEHERRTTARQSADGAAERGQVAGSGRLVEQVHREGGALGDGLTYRWLVARLELLEPKD